MRVIAVQSLFLVTCLLLTPRKADADLALYVGTYGTDSVTLVNQSGASSNFISSVGGPLGMAFDSSGNFYVANNNNSVLEYSSTGTFIKTFATVGDDDERIAFDRSGNLYVANIFSNSVSEYSSSGSFLKTITGGLSFPYGVVCDSIGDLFVSNFYGNSITEYSSAGVFLRTITGNLNAPSQMVFDTSGNLYVTNDGGTIEKFSSMGVDLGLFASGRGDSYGLAYDPSTETFYQSNYDNNSILEYSSTGTFLGNLATNLSNPLFLAIDVPTIVPEPPSIIMILIGLAGFAIFISRRPKSNVA